EVAAWRLRKRGGCLGLLLTCLDSQKACQRTAKDAPCFYDLLDREIDPIDDKSVADILDSLREVARSASPAVSGFCRVGVKYREAHVLAKRLVIDGSDWVRRPLHTSARLQQRPCQTAGRRCAVNRASAGEVCRITTARIDEVGYGAIVG